MAGHIRSTTLTGMALASVALLLAGCASNLGPSSRSHQPMTVRTVSTDDTNAPVTPGQRVRLNDQSLAAQPDDVTFAQPTPTRRAAGLDASLIGLYGELASSAPQPPTNPDGARNIVQVTTASEGAVFDPAIDSNGTLMAFASTMHSTTADIYLQSTTGSTITQLTDDPGDDVMPAFSPDGRHVAFASNRAGNWNIYYVPTTGGRPVQLTFDAEHELHPSWSPDGTLLAYCRFGQQSGRWEIWTVDIENPSVRRFLVYGMFPEWNPDVARSKLLFQRPRQRGSRHHSIWTIDYVNGEAKQPTEIVSAANAAAINPGWSPDGSRIVFVTVLDPEAEPAARPGHSDVWVVTIDGTNRINLTSSGSANYQPTWAADGNVYFVSDRSGVDNIWSVSASHEGYVPTAPSNMATVDPQSQHPSDQP